MTDIKTMIEVMQAFADGKAIEYKHKIDSVWAMSGNAPLWAWSIVDYRIKQVPKVIYVNEYGGGCATHKSRELAIENSNAADRTAVKYMEVIE
jgi:hypothetical protein